MASRTTVNKEHVFRQPARYIFIFIFIVHYDRSSPHVETYIKVNLITSQRERKEMAVDEVSSIINVNW